MPLGSPNAAILKVLIALLILTLSLQCSDILSCLGILML